jgi:hypothetical protein
MALPALALAVTFLPATGRADPYRWCAQYSEWTGSGGQNCGFVTLRQCRATISGIGGVCVPNPYYTGPARATTGYGPSHRSRHHRYER